MTLYPSIDTSSCFAPFPLDIQRTLLQLDTQPVSTCNVYPQRALAPIKLPSLPYQDLPQSTRALAINEFLCIRNLNVHVRVDAYQATVVFGLAPFETDYDWLVDTVRAQIY